MPVLEKNRCELGEREWERERFWGELGLKNQFSNKTAIMNSGLKDLHDWSNQISGKKATI